MGRRSVAVRVAVAVALGAIFGCRHPVGDEYLRYAQMSYDASAFNRLGVGDTFEIRVFQQAEMSGDYTVSQSGTIAFPFIGSVTVQDRTCGEVEHEVAERLAENILVDPTVSCRVLELRSLRIVVNGEVREPGRFGYSDDLTVVEAIALAGGINENASGDRVIVTRIIDGVTHEIETPLREILRGQAPNFRLWPNDIVTVPAYTLLR
jgi:polysaccharide export outer membrane protein